MGISVFFLSSATVYFFAVIGCLKYRVNLLRNSITKHILCLDGWDLIRSKPEAIHSDRQSNGAEVAKLLIA
jgi:hypothetical protein